MDVTVGRLFAVPAKTQSEVHPLSVTWKFRNRNMKSVSKIVVGVEMPTARPWNAYDLAPACRLAVKQAFELAAGQQTVVALVSVLPEPSGGLFGSEEEAKAQSEQDCRDAAELLETVGRNHNEAIGQTVEVTCSVATGRPWLEILKAAGTNRDHLIICGTRDKGAVSRLLFGSTGLKLLRNAACPVWLVKPRVDDDADLDVLAATDLSEVGMDIIGAGVALGQSLPVRLTLFHAVDDELERHMARTGTTEEDLSGYRQQARTEAQEKLHEQLAQTDYRTMEKGVTVQIAEGPADACILSAIEELNIDLLIMATSGRGGIPGMLFGNTAERLLPELPCSILALKPDDFECPVDLNSV